MKIKAIFALVIFLAIFLVEPAFAMEDPYYNEQWYLAKIGATEAWSTTRGSDAVTVAVLDTGVDITQPDLANNFWYNKYEVPNDGIDNDNNGYIDDINGWDFVVGSPDVRPKIKASYSEAAVNHGTFVAGIISAIHDNGFGIKGITTNVKIMPLIVLDTTGYGGSTAVAKAIDYAVKNGADIINLSFGGTEHSSILKTSIINAYNKGVLIVAAGGNAVNGGRAVDMTSAPLYPICYDQELSENMVLGVVATDKDNKITSYSNYGKGCIDLAAPGDDIVSLGYYNSQIPAFTQYVREGWRGSSFASAMVSGGAAMLKSANRSLRAKDMFKILTEESGLLVMDLKYKDKAGQGLLDIKRAIDKVTGGQTLGPSPVATPAPKIIPSPNIPVNTSAQILVATKSKGEGKIIFFNSLFQKSREVEVLDGGQFQGLNLALADVNGDGSQDIVVGAVKGDQPFVRVLNSTDQIITSFMPYDVKFRGGVEVAAGDIDKDGKAEIIVAPESGEKPIVKVYDQTGKLIKQFLVFNEKFRGGLNIAVGDVNGDGKAEIVVAPKKGLMPKIKIYNDQGVMLKSLLVFPASFTGGVSLTLVDLNKDGHQDIIVGAGPGGSPQVQAFAYDGSKMANFLAFTAKMNSGVEVSSFDWNADGWPEIMVAAGPPGGPHVKIFDKYGNYLNQFFALDTKFNSGINILGR